MIVKNTDLHTHSYYSDGQITPTQLVRLAKKKRIKYLALTDHDSVKGIKEAVAEGKRIGVTVIPAVELRTDNGEMLGYFIDVNNKELKKELKRTRKITENKVKEWCNRLNKLGFKISFKEIQKKYPKSKNNLNEFYVLYHLHKKGYGTTREVADMLYSSKKTKSKKIKTRTPLQAIRLIKKAGGVPVLAHPWFKNIKRHFKNMKKYVKAGLKGIEICNGDDEKFMNQITKMKNTALAIKKIAKKYNLILTSGTDFHGKKLIKLMPGKHDLGKCNCDERVVRKLEKLK